jgi:hypothetical protein
MSAQENRRPIGFRLLVEIFFAGLVIVMKPCTSSCRVPITPLSLHLSANLFARLQEGG